MLKIDSFSSASIQARRASFEVAHFSEGSKNWYCIESEAPCSRLLSKHTTTQGTRYGYSATKPNLTKATPDDVKILMTNAMHLSLSQIIDLYTIRWQIELFFKELKSRLGFDQYRFKSFSEVEGWVRQQ